MKTPLEITTHVFSSATLLTFYWPTDAGDDGTRTAKAIIHALGTTEEEFTSCTIKQ